MLKVQNLAYYFGEFGCLNYSLLSHIEEQQPKLEIATQPDYLKLMQMKCKSIKASNKMPKDYVNLLKEQVVGHGFSVKSQYIDRLEDLGYKHIKHYLNLASDKCSDHRRGIQTPIVSDNEVQGEYIGLSFRNRSHDSYRNVEGVMWEKVIMMIKKHTDLPIIAHGMKLDTLSSTDFGIKITESLEESIAYMNKTKLFIGSMSGISQFASNCACPIVQIGPLGKHFHYDPFDKGCWAVAGCNGEFEQILLQCLKRK